MNFDLKSFQIGLALGMAGKSLPFSMKEPIAYLYNGVRLPPIPNEIADYPYLCVLQNGTNRYEVYGSHSRIYISPGVNLGFGLSTWGYLESCEVSYATNSDFTSWSEGPIEESGSLGLSDGYSVLWCNVDIEQEGTVICKASEPVLVYE